MTKKILLLNAPPGAGKDHGAKYITKQFMGAKLDKFARVLKERTHALYGFPWRAWDYYEDCKDLPNDDFYGKTPRECYIAVSETYFKVQHGDRIFGQILADELDKYDWELIAISDSGFMEEAEVLIEKYGDANVVLARIFREDCDFSKDSRDYLDFDDRICTIDIYNDGTDKFTDKLQDLVEKMYAH